MILADRTQLQQVLLNLVRNAAEAMASHGARDALGRIGKLGAPGHDGEIVISVAEPVAASLIITISDNGPGIPPRIADRLFQPFVSTKPAGMGIGLVICHTIVEGHGGQLIHARTASGAEGSVFRIALPIPQSAGEHEWPQS
jgi:two-component system sensor kinase FixL